MHLRYNICVIPVLQPWRMSAPSCFASKDMEILQCTKRLGNTSTRVSFAWLCCSANAKVHSFCWCLKTSCLVQKLHFLQFIQKYMYRAKFGMQNSSNRTDKGPFLFRPKLASVQKTVQQGQFRNCSFFSETVMSAVPWFPVQVPPMHVNREGIHVFESKLFYSMFQIHVAEMFFEG